VRLICALVVVCVSIAYADEASLLRGLDTDDPRALAQAVGAIERAPATVDLADVLFAAGRACEDRLYDPARALALYDRIVRELPDSRVAVAAGRRIEKLTAMRAYAHEAAELAQLRANADTLRADDVIRRGDALTRAAWPGASDATLWLADWLCRTKRFADAQARYAQLFDREPLALRNAAGCAIEAHDWPLAEQLARRLPTGDEIERAVREDLFRSAAQGRRRDRLLTLSWLALALSIAGMLASLGDAMWRGGFRVPKWQPPIEVMFLAPVAAVIVLASFTAHRAIAPAVTRISVLGIALAWVSGAALDLLRSRGRAVRVRAVLHIVACILGVLAIGYIAMTRDGLLDMLSETVQFGPGA